MPDNGPVDADLVRAFRSGDVLGFDGLFQRYERPIFNYTYRMVGESGAAEDLTQEVFLRVFSSLGKAGEIANVRAWLYRIATNLAISHLRRGQRRVMSLEDGLDRGVVDEPVGGERQDPEGRQLRREDVRQLELALRHLSDTHRQALVLRQLQGLTYQEMAEVMGLSLEAVTSLLHRARSEFRAHLGRIGQAGGLERQTREGRSQ